jgi:hypothetical protein
MNHAPGVRGLERGRNLQRQPERLLDRERTTEALGQRLAFDQFQHEEAGVAGLLEPMDGPDVRVAHRRQEPGFPLEAGATVGIRRELARKHLEGDVTPESLVPGAIHLAHPALAQLLEDAIWPERLISHRILRNLVRGPPAFGGDNPPDERMCQDAAGCATPAADARCRRDRDDPGGQQPRSLQPTAQEMAASPSCRGRHLGGPYLNSGRRAPGIPRRLGVVSPSWYRTGATPANGAAAHFGVSSSACGARPAE